MAVTKSTPDVSEIDPETVPEVVEEVAEKKSSGFDHVRPNGYDGGDRGTNGPTYLIVARSIWSVQVKKELEKVGYDVRIGLSFSKKTENGSQTLLQVKLIDE